MNEGKGEHRGRNERPTAASTAAKSSLQPTGRPWAARSTTERVMKPSAFCVAALAVALAAAAHAESSS